MKDLIRSRTGEPPVAKNNKRAADAAEGGLLLECRKAPAKSSESLCPARSAQVAALADSMPKCEDCGAAAADEGVDFELDAEGLATCIHCSGRVPACDRPKMDQ